MNDWGKVGWDGPRPPEGTGVHHYQFELFALDRVLNLQPKAAHKTVRAAMAGKIVGRAVLVGTYQNLAERAGQAV